MEVILWNGGPNYNEYIMYRTLGPYKIAHTTRKAGYSAQVIDFVNFLSYEDLLKCTEKFISKETKVLGIGTNFIVEQHQLPDHIVSVLNLIGEKYPWVRIVVGGWYAKSLTLKNNIEVPFCIINEYGEDIFLDLLNHYINKTEEPPYSISLKFGKIVKVYFKSRNPQYNIETDDFMFTDNDAIMPNETLPLEISRGCIFKCKFCNHLLLGRGKLDYLRNFELVKNELMNNYEKWGVKNYYIICDTFNDTEFKIKEWHKMVSSLPFKIKYTAYLRADLLDKFPDSPYLLKDSGLFTAFHGIETLTPESAMVIGKGWSGKRAKDYIPELYHNIWNKEVYQTVSCIVGLPADTRDTFEDFLNWFESNDLYHLAVHPLGINNNSLNKNLSEFDKNSEKYGYRFLEKDRPWIWSNDYWNLEDAEEFIKSKLPRIGKLSSPFGSWNIMSLIQHGLDEKSFSKPEVFNLNIDLLKENRKHWLSNYVDKILSL